MSESQESIVRGQALLLMARNYNKQHIIQRVIKRFMKCLILGVKYDRSSSI